MTTTIDIAEILDLKVEDGVINVPVEASLDGHPGRITLRLDPHTAENLRARTTAGLVTARVQQRQR
jgi:hypothetical protein